MPSIRTRPSYLFVLPWSLHHIGGVNQVVANLAQNMREKGTYEPLVLTSDWSAPDPIFEEVHGIRTVRWRVRPYRKGMGIKESLAFTLWETRFRSRFAQFCMEQDVKVINPHYPGDSAFTLDRVVRSNGGGLPIMLSFHGTDVSNLKNLSDQQKGEWRGLIRRTHRTIVCSKQLGQRLEDALGSDVPYQVLYNGVTAEKFVRQHDAALPADPDIILHVGKFDRNKGQDVLIEAFSLIAGKFPGASLHLVGSSGESLNHLRDLAQERGVAHRMEFFVDISPEEMPAYYERASMFAFPSRQEGFPLVLLEAGAAGLPVVATRVGGIPELIDGETTGMLIEPNDPVGLADALCKFLSEPSFAQRLGTGLRQRVRASFSWEHAFQQYEALAGEEGLDPIKA